MRTIKFRAFHPGRKVMVYSDKPHRDLGTFFDHIIHPHEDWELMQYIGLNDKNGKEIYEGDIFILNMDDEEWYDYVEYRTYEAKFELRRFKRHPSDCDILFASKQRNCEVIGNIHENPELINQ